MLTGRRVRGFTLIEALVALLVMLAGLAGAASLLIQTVRYERESATRRAALRQSASLADELRALRTGGGLRPDASRTAIDGWVAALQAALPAGGVAGAIRDADSGIYVLSAEWPASGGDTHRLRLPVQP